MQISSYQILLSQVPYSLLSTAILPYPLPTKPQLSSDMGYLYPSGESGSHSYGGGSTRGTLLPWQGFSVEWAVMKF